MNLFADKKHRGEGESIKLARHRLVLLRLFRGAPFESERFRANIWCDRHEYLDLSCDSAKLDVYTLNGLDKQNSIT